MPYPWGDVLHIQDIEADDSTTLPPPPPSNLAACPGINTSTPVATATQEVLVDVTLHRYKLETKTKADRVAGKGGRGGAGGGDGPEYIFNRALPPVRDGSGRKFAVELG